MRRFTSKAARYSKEDTQVGGLGCGGLLGLFIVIAIIAGITTGKPSPEEQGTPVRALSSGTPLPAFQTVREAFLAGSESGDELRAVGREFNDDFVQEAVSRVKSEIFGDSDKWIVSNSDIIAVCDVYYRSGDASARGEGLTLTELEDILRKELGVRGSFLLGAIQSGASGNSEAIDDFCAPISAYGIGFSTGFEVTADLYELDPNESDAPAQLDSAIDGLSRTKLRTDRQTAYGKGFLAGWLLPMRSGLSMVRLRRRAYQSSTSALLALPTSPIRVNPLLRRSLSAFKMAWCR